MGNFFVYAPRDRKGWLKLWQKKSDVVIVEMK